MEKYNVRTNSKDKLSQILSKEKTKKCNYLIIKDNPLPDINFKSSRKIVAIASELDKLNETKTKESIGETKVLQGNSFNIGSEKGSHLSKQRLRSLSKSNLLSLAKISKGLTPKHKRNGGQDFSPIKLRLPSVSATNKNTNSNLRKYIKANS
ncbi:hypothetical protein SteCoe_20962 [Stentor coeruleus]|uniref:Uncharacterized protein n=1 Tax=Stentor coeruleus TaxID=5963 RepID=A0A1R2BQM3_9CILI|nr:hypothetical protein SteCoe_20962 [Stentor coeruleus]